MADYNVIYNVHYLNISFTGRWIDVCLLVSPGLQPGFNFWRLSYQLSSFEVRPKYRSTVHSAILVTKRSVGVAPEVHASDEADM